MTQCKSFPQKSWARFTGQAFENWETTEIIIYAKEGYDLSVLLSTKVEDTGKHLDLHRVIDIYSEINVRVYTEVQESHPGINELNNCADVETGVSVDRLLVIIDERVYIENGVLVDGNLVDCDDTNICTHDHGTAEAFRQNILNP